MDGADYHHEEDPEDRLAWHARLADNMVDTMCIATCGLGSATQDEHNDHMENVAGLMLVFTLIHSYTPKQIEQALVAIDRIADDVKRAFIRAAAEGKPPHV